METLAGEKDEIEKELATSKTIALASVSSKESELFKRDESIKALEEQLAAVTSEKESLKVNLKEKEEALVNSKMIISSLEKSNKSMLEDLHIRLHDSNTAIVSLMSKIQNLEVEIDQLRKGREEEANKLKKDALDSADRLAHGRAS